MLSRFFIRFSKNRPEKSGPELSKVIPEMVCMISKTEKEFTIFPGHGKTWKESVQDFGFGYEIHYKDIDGNHKIKIFQKNFFN